MLVAMEALASAVPLAVQRIHRQRPRTAGGQVSANIGHMAIETGSKDNISCMIVILGGAGGSPLT